MEPLLTVEDLSKKLKLSRSAVYALKEKVGYLKIGGAVRFRLEDILRFLESCRVNGNGKARKPSTRLAQLRHLRR